MSDLSLSSMHLSLIRHPGLGFTVDRNFSIYLVHDDAKDKEFGLEMSWIGDETGGEHVAVPKELMEEAERKGKEAIEQFED